MVCMVVSSKMGPSSQLPSQYAGSEATTATEIVPSSNGKPGTASQRDNKRGNLLPRFRGRSDDESATVEVCKESNTVSRTKIADVSTGLMVGARVSNT